MNAFLLGYVKTKCGKRVNVAFGAIGFCGPLGGDNGGIAALFQGIKSEIRRGGEFYSVEEACIEELKAIYDCILEELSYKLTVCIYGEFNNNGQCHVAGFSSKNLLDLIGKINEMKRNYILRFSCGSEIDLSEGVWYDLRGVQFREYGPFENVKLNQLECENEAEK